MTIQEAIKSGRPFKRKSERQWFEAYTDGDSYLSLERHPPEFEHPLRLEYVLADDWEIKE